MNKPNRSTAVCTCVPIQILSPSLADRYKHQNERECNFVISPVSVKVENHPPTIELLSRDDELLRDVPNQARLSKHMRWIASDTESRKTRTGCQYYTHVRQCRAL